MLFLITILLSLMIHMGIITQIMIMDIAATTGTILISEAIITGVIILFSGTAGTLRSASISTLATDGITIITDGTTIITIMDTIITDPTTIRDMIIMEIIIHTEIQHQFTQRDVDKSTPPNL